MNVNIENAKQAIVELPPKKGEEEGGEDVNELYVELGARLQKISNDASGSDSFAMTAPIPQSQGAADALLNLGKRFFARVEKQAFDMICGGDPEDQELRDQMRQKFGPSFDASDVAAVIAAALVAHAAMVPAVALLVAKLVVKLFGNPAQKTIDEAMGAMCHAWKGRVHP